MCSFTGTFDAVADPPRSAAALEAAGRVGARRVSVAVVGSDLALVNI